MTNNINSIRARAAKSGSRMMHGGYAGVPFLSSEETKWIDSLIDTLIPPEDGWPGAEKLGISELLVDYLVPAQAPVSLYPHFGREEFPKLVRSILKGSDGSLEMRIAALQVVEENEPQLFARLRDFVYYVYYGHPNVVALIRERTKYGGDYLGGGQPEGYTDVLESWGSRRFSNRGVFIPTAVVSQVPQAERRLS